MIFLYIYIFFYRVVIKMGLLTDTKQRQVLVHLILKYHQKLSVLLYIAGLAWFLALAYRPLNAGTYFSENALLPGGSLD